MSTADPTVTTIAQLIAQLGVAAIFVMAWRQERDERQKQQERFEKERQDMQDKYDKRYDELSARLIGLLETMLNTSRSTGNAEPPIMRSQ